MCYHSIATPYCVLYADLWDAQGSLNQLLPSSSCLSCMISPYPRLFIKAFRWTNSPYASSRVRPFLTP